MAIGIRISARSKSVAGESIPRPFFFEGSPAKANHCNITAGILRDLEKDPFQPHLKYHYLGGKYKGMQAISITDSYRITMTVMITEKEILLIDIGPHDEVYR